MREYTSEDYEFAIRMLHHRKELAKEEVDEWMKHPEHWELLEEMAAMRAVTGNARTGGCEQERGRIRSRIQRNRRIRLIIGMAASVMILLGAWHFLRNMPPQSMPPLAVQTHIEPGETKARLILPGGKVVNLTAREQKIVVTEKEVIRNDSLNGLKYQMKDASEMCEDYHTLQVPLGGFYKLELSDGTKVWLNAGSELRYPVQFSDTERDVFLKGEGYFEVAKNQHKPFYVLIQQAKITVLGTSFNISAYPEEKEIVATLVNGSVRFHAEKKNTEVVLKPGEQCTMEMGSGKTTVAKVDTEQYTAWINGRFVFRDMSLEAIMRQLERWYDFQIIYAQPDIKTDKFRGVIQRDSKIEDVFKAIELTMNVKFSMNGKQVTVEKR